MRKTPYKTSNIYFTKKSEGKHGTIDLMQFSLFLKKSDIEKLFDISPKIINVYSSRNKYVLQKRKIENQEEILIDLFESLPFLLKHTRRVGKEATK